MTLTLFDGGRIIARGTAPELAEAARAALARGGAPLALEDATGRTVDLDLSAPTPGTDPAPKPAPRPRGRPRLGVTAREVTLLPRHWDWLARQPGGASATLRRLVEEARRAGAPREARREAAAAAYAAATTLAGDRPGYEEAMRALFAGDAAALRRHAAAWPADIRDHVLALARLDPAPPPARD